MRLDKYLKVSRLIKRRTVANELAKAGRVKVNDRLAKPGTKVKVEDKVSLTFGDQETLIVIKKIDNVVRKDQADEMYEIVQ